MSALLCPWPWSVRPSPIVKAATIFRSSTASHTRESPKTPDSAPLIRKATASQLPSSSSVLAPRSSQNTAKMSFGGQTPTIIVLKEGTKTQIYPTVAAHRCPPSNEATDTRSLTKVGLQEPTPPRAKARSSPTSMPVLRSKPPSSRRWAPTVVTC